MSIICSGQLIKYGNIVVTGDFNILRGLNTTVIGNGNTISGRRARVEGDHNVVSGEISTINGNNNNVSGKHSKINGNGNTVSGNHSKINGNGNNVSGNYSEVRGENNVVTGKFCQVINVETGTLFANQRNNASSRADPVFGLVLNNAGRLIYADGNVTINTTATTTFTTTTTTTDTVTRALDRRRTMTTLNDPDGTNIDGVVELTYPDEERPDGAPCCVVCMSREPDVIAMPCLHKQFCGVCVVGMKNNNNPINQATNKIKCPVCNADVDKFGKVY